MVSAFLSGFKKLGTNFKSSRWTFASCRRPLAFAMSMRIASSLTELFAPHIHQQRLDTWPEKYPWVDPEGMKYFKYRLGQARRDVKHGLEVTKDFFSNSRALQDRALEILQFKLDVLWSLADAIMLQQCEISVLGSKQG